MTSKVPPSLDSVETFGYRVDYGQNPSPSIVRQPAFAGYVIVCARMGRFTAGDANRQRRQQQQQDEAFCHNLILAGIVSTASMG